MALAKPHYANTSHPIDIVENMAIENAWPTERTCEEELTFSVRGNWSDYNISISWRGDLPAMHIALAFEMHIPEARANEVYRLIAMINEQMWVGHFDVWPKEAMALYRYGLMLQEQIISRGQAGAMIEQALNAVERYYQAFQYVVWAGKSAREALDSTLFETRGCA